MIDSKANPKPKAIASANTIVVVFFICLNANYLRLRSPFECNCIQGIVEPTAGRKSLLCYQIRCFV